MKYQYQLNMNVCVCGCTILCTVERGAAVTLAWYREGETQSYGISLSRDAPDAYLPQTVEKGGTYTCEAKNYVNTETASITVGLHCTDSSLSGGEVAGIVVSLLLFVAVITMIIAMWKNQRMPGWSAIFSRDAQANEQNDANSLRQRHMSVPEDRLSVPETKPFVSETKPFVSETKPFVSETQPFVSETEISVPETQPFISETETSPDTSS
ncbi:hypothetical protein AAFF_G00172000 [Aldrovandia affinis]|uniref:Ig-like domain-containing protein n=1 Tax=Aldrovandia affinis TaxID=143900 RepID=A0AAD7WWU6_9TELE|nr:hypothetical protein AAFF_G00172000 [Aldrovandia affinis]